MPCLETIKPIFHDMEEILETRQTIIAELNFLTNMHNKGTKLKEANRL